MRRKAKTTPAPTIPQIVATVPTTSLVVEELMPTAVTGSLKKWSTAVPPANIRWDSFDLADTHKRIEEALKMPTPPELFAAPRTLRCHSGQFDMAAERFLPEVSMTDGSFDDLSVDLYVEHMAKGTLLDTDMPVGYAGPSWI